MANIVMCLSVTAVDIPILKSTIISFNNFISFVFSWLGKARRIKQAKEEASAEVEAYRKERERQYKELEQAVCGF